MPISDLDNLVNADPTVLTGPDKLYGANVDAYGSLQTGAQSLNAILTGLAAALNADAIVSTDVSKYCSASIQITGIFSGTLTFQGSNDATNWFSIQGTNLSVTSQPPVQTVTAPGLFFVPLCFKYLRVRMTSYTSGTANVVTILDTLAATDLKARNSTLYGTYSGTQVPVQVDVDGKIAINSTVVSSLPAVQITAVGAVSAGATVFTSYTATQKLAIKQFYAGGTGIGRQFLYLSSPSATQFVNEGDFENTGAIGTTWIWASTAGTGSIATSTTQVKTGTRSVALTFSNSSGTNAQGVKQTFSTPSDFSGWRYLEAWFYNVVSAGGTYTRSVSIILTDSSAATRTYLVSGTSITSPFNASGWIQILGEIENPTSATGTFDITSVASIELRMLDSANRAGTVFWDTVRFSSMLTPVFPIYHLGNLSFNIAIDPVIVLNVGDQVIIAQKNNDTARREYFASAAGVAI